MYLEYTNQMNFTHVTYNKSHMIKIPRLKATIEQGDLMAKLLSLVGEKTVNSYGYVFKKSCDSIREKGYGKDLTQEKEKKFEESAYSRMQDFCEYFQLISKQRDEIMLTFFGQKLLSLMQNDKQPRLFDPKYASLLGKIYLYVDHADQHGLQIIEMLKHCEGTITADGIAEQLQQRGDVDLALSANRRSQIRSKLWSKGESENIYWQDLEVKVNKQLGKIDRDRSIKSIQQLLSFYIKAELIKKSDTGYELNREYVDKLQGMEFWNEQPIKRSLFLQELESAYNLWSKQLKLTDVPLPYLRYTLCERLNIPWKRLDDIIVKVLHVKTGEYVFALSQSRFPEKWGIELNRRNVYYIAIIKGGV